MIKIKSFCASKENMEKIKIKRQPMENDRGMDMYTLLYLKWITNKDQLYTTWNLLNVLWQPGWDGSLGDNGYMYMYG